MSEDDYGRKRQTDFEYALTGGKAMEAVKMSSPMESLLKKAGMPEREIPEAATVIVMGMNKMGPNAPETARMDLITTLMGQCAKDKPDIVKDVMTMAVAKMDSGGGMTMQAKSPAMSAYTPPKRGM